MSLFKENELVMHLQIMFGTHRTNLRRQIKHTVMRFLCITVFFVERCFRGNFISRIAMGIGNKIFSFYTWYAQGLLSSDNCSLYAQSEHPGF